VIDVLRPSEAAAQLALNQFARSLQPGLDHERFTRRAPTTALKRMKAKKRSSIYPL
jgi:hypothetical protein